MKSFMKLRAVIILMVSIILLVSCERTAVYKAPPYDGKNYVIDLSGLREGRPEFYSVSVNNKTVSFFVIMVDGEAQSYFNACRKCYPHKLGFRSQDGYIVCNYCNERYAPDMLKEGIGSCYPIRLKGTVKSGKYLIARETLSEGTKCF